MPNSLKQSTSRLILMRPRKVKKSVLDFSSSNINNTFETSSYKVNSNDAMMVVHMEGQPKSIEKSIVSSEEVIEANDLVTEPAKLQILGIFILVEFDYDFGADEFAGCRLCLNFVKNVSTETLFVSFEVAMGQNPFEGIPRWEPPKEFAWGTERFIVTPCFHVVALQRRKSSQR
ncbi:hypothetical protein VNO78_14702 [Psophocarpus tetragonolobus]|uniref:Uncharacterized protein n=1 Tax=Psophocarpus tetragonolobus TaxID=3891 RepID=A0AAN9XJ54_PSOTE